jgi:outer membrane protein
MKCFNYLGVVTALFVIQPSLARDASPVTSRLSIKSYLDLAVQKNEVTRLNRAQREQFEAKKDQALATVLPQLKLAGNYVQQQPLEGSKPDDNKSSAARVNLSQPLLGLYKGAKTLDVAKKQLEATELGGDDAVLQFKLSLNDSFHAVVSSMSDLAGYDEVQKIASKRVKEISDRVKIGRSKPADLFAAQAQLASAEAQLEQAKTTVLTSRSNLAQISGLELDADLTDQVALPAKAETLAAYIGGVNGLPSVKALEAQVMASDAQAAAVRAQRVPDLDLTANYYLKREERLKDVKWDVGLQLSWPVYDGGLISGRVREATAQKTLYTEQLSQKKRLSEMKIRQYHQTFEASLRTLPIFERAVAMAQKNYDAIAKDYRLGLATVLDLIQSSNSLAEAKRVFNRQTINAKSQFVALKLAAGQNL